MAVTKIKPIKSTLKKALDYILNPDKTDGKMLVSSFGCSYETADIEFGFTLSKALEKGSNLAHHLIKSFEPGESTPEQAHEIGKRLAEEVLGGRHEYVLATHIDRGHIHSHLIFCAASFMDYKKYVSNRKSYYGIRNASDRLCKEYGLSVVKPGQSKGKSYVEYAADRYGGGSWKSKLKVAIDTLIPQSKDFEDLLKRLQEQGYEIKRGKYISIRASGQERLTRTKTLGVDYTEEAITKRIAGEYACAVPLPKPKRKPAYARPALAVNLIIDIENCIKVQQSAGFARWQKIQNLKEAAKTLNFLTENNLLQYADLEARNDELSIAFDEAADSLKVFEKRLTDMAVLIKHMTTYQQTKPVYDGLKTAKIKNAYRAKYESKLILHEASTKALRKYSGDEKPPSLATLKKEHDKLSERKNILLVEFDKLKKQSREYGIVKKNVDSILNPRIERRRGRVIEIDL